MAFDLDNLSAFLAVARAGGFRDAARTAGVGASTLSAAVRQLGSRLGVRLLHRTTRSVALTEAGQRLMDRLAPAFAEIDAALQDAKSLANQPAGTLRLNVPGAVALLVLPQVLPAFLAALPNIEVEVMTDESFVDVLAAGCDAGIRYEERWSRT
jgi:DNA-binding transcriptional LysR family regulator